MNKTTLMIMCGLPFAGKTTLAKKISEKTGAEMVAFDWIYAEKKRGETPDLDIIEDWNFILNIAHQRITGHLAEGKSVVYDDISVRKEQRDALREIARKQNANFFIIYLNTPMQVIKRREENNKISKERHQVASINFNKALAQWQEPLGEKGVLELSPETDFNEWVNYVGGL